MDTLKKEMMAQANVKAETEEVVVLGQDDSDHISDINSDGSKQTAYLHSTVGGGRPLDGIAGVRRKGVPTPPGHSLLYLRKLVSTVWVAVWSADGRARVARCDWSSAGRPVFDPVCVIARGAALPETRDATAAGRGNSRAAVALR
ncbi:hypothetical protein DIPPA_01174 [Diplonema papillatum]|nr:hypothetical protein DIPPA_01174 [Diplonema papillatum]|eukprot:gene7660-11745_t